MKLNCTPDEIIEYVSEAYPEIDQLLFDANLYCHKYKGSVQPYQAAVLYYLAKDYNHCNILEIGTGVGYSTFFLANAAPQAQISTVNPIEDEINIAINTLNNAGIKNIKFNKLTSREWYEETQDNHHRGFAYPDDTYDFIFIDGNHKDIEFDINWYKRLNNDGIIVFHDYSDTNSKSSCPPVFNALNEFRNTVGDFDVLVKDTINCYGLAGWYK